MISCAVLERPGRWRAVGLAFVFALVLVPILPLLAGALERAGGTSWLGSGFAAALGRGLRLAVAVAAVALATGWPCGVLAGLFRFRGRRFLLAALLLPLLAPPFLWALGWSMTASLLDRGTLLDGLGGTALAFQAAAFPLVFFASLAATRGISSGQSGATRLAGGEAQLVRQALRHSFGAALLAALLAAGMSLADPGPGQVLGYDGASAQILISFSALYDFPLAARQCLAVAGLALVAVTPAALLLAPTLARGLLARDVQAAPLLGRPVWSKGVAVLLTLAVILLIALPATGLLRPALDGFPLERVTGEIARTLGNTVFYGGGAALLAVALGLVAAICTGRSPTTGAVLLGGMMLVLALPPALGALGLVHAASGSPAALDPLLRSRFTVALWLGLRLFPVAALFLMRRMGETAPSWAPAAAVHGMPLRPYLRQVLLPWLAPAAGISGVAVALFAVADIYSALLLHPPGESSLPLAIFTVQANAPETFVASLCLAYLGGAALLLAALVPLFTTRTT